MKSMVGTEQISIFRPAALFVIAIWDRQPRRIVWFRQNFDRVTADTLQTLKVKGHMVNVI